MPSFSLLEAGGWKASYVSSRGRFGSGILTGYVDAEKLTEEERWF